VRALHGFTGHGTEFDRRKRQFLAKWYVDSLPMAFWSTVRGSRSASPELYPDAVAQYDARLRRSRPARSA
jgi:hypothetical protein